MLHVFPLFPILMEDGVPTCGCVCTDDECPGRYQHRPHVRCMAVGKHPAVKDYQNFEGVEKDADGGCGVPTGSRNGILVVEGDVRPAKGIDGVATLLAMGPMPETTVVETPTESAHFYFQWPSAERTGGRSIRNSASLLGPGIDVRGEGGFVVGPGSPHKKGGTYEIVVDVEPAPLPDWLLERLLAIESAKGPEVPDSPALVDKTGDELIKAVEWAEEYLLKAEPCVQDGTSSAKLLRYASAVRAKRIPVAMCLELLLEWDVFNKPPWGESELKRALRSAERGTAVTQTAREHKAFEGMLDRLRGDAPVAPVVEDDGRIIEGNCERPKGETAKTSLANFAADLRVGRHWEGSWQYDDLRKWITCTKNAPIRLDAQKGNITSVDYTRVRAWAERNGLLASKETVMDAIEMVAMESKYNPVLQYLEALPKPKDHSALEMLAKRCLGNDSGLAQLAITKTLIAAVRRMRTPGTKVDTVLVLQGHQGKRKSSFLNVLFGDEYVKSQMPDLASKDASVGLRGMWCVELAEMDRVIRAETATVKEFITRAVDSYRPPYGHVEQQFPRQCIFIGTTNDQRFLVDETGNRRYWVVEVNEYDLKWLAKHRGEIWAAACELEAAGVEHWFENETDALELQRPYEFVDAWELPIRDYLTGKSRISNAAEVYTEAIARGDHSALAKLDRRIQNRIMNILTCRLGCTVRKSCGKYWLDIPAEIAQSEPSPEEMSRRAASNTMSALRKMAVN